MKRHLWKIGIAALVLVAGALGATALAARALHGGHGEFMRRHVAAFIDDALDSANVTPAQRDSVHAAEERAFAAFAASHHDRKADLDKALALFESDQIDAKQVAAMRDQHQAEMKKTADAVTQAIVDAHDALTPAERKAVADYVREHRPGKNGARLRGEMMKHFADAKIDEALDAVQATPAQRAQIDAARDQLMATLEQLHAADPGEHVQRALALFEDDRIDPAAVQSLRDEQAAKMKKAGDAIVQALYDVHDALTAPQRHALVEWVRAQRAKWHEHRGMHMGPLDGETHGG